MSADSLLDAMQLTTATDAAAPPLFVYGTLLDTEMLAAATGRALDGTEWLPAIVKGWRVVTMPGRAYPGLARDAGDHASGMVLIGLRMDDLRRLSAYEGDEYRLGLVTAVLTGTVEGPRNTAAAVYLPVAATPAEGVPWSLAEWQAAHKSVALGALSGHAPQP